MLETIIARSTHDKESRIRFRIALPQSIFFIKSPEEGRLVRQNYRETSSLFSLGYFVIYVYIFVLDKIAGFGCRHFV